MSAPQPYTCADMAAICGIKLRTFYKTRRKLHLIDGMPKPFATGKWDRATVDAWRGRHHPLAPKPQPANDTTALPPPADDAQWRGFLDHHYGAERA